jgi:hypothetical protein
MISDLPVNIAVRVHARNDEARRLARTAALQRYDEVEHDMQRCTQYAVQRMHSQLYLFSPNIFDSTIIFF